VANDNGEYIKMISLCDLLPGQTAEVVKIDTVDSNRLLKLSALGLVPGSLIRLQQRLPAYVIWVGETQLSLDQDVARAIQLLKM
jgi:DtxR family Mn-dependent transcriptional regulator